ncbi:phage protease [Fulvimarina sp. MAC3]|uniref:phage protease n=1 Tax=Fulvimarina sp. MAC3 TaxID=3148887 RepID=UPI0031FCBA1D
MDGTAHFPHPIVTLAVGGELDTKPTTSGWIKIAPRGRVTDRNGVSHAFDPELLASRFNADETKVPLDFDHSTVLLGAKGQRSDAIGWIEEMEARADGLYGRVDWLDTGKAALGARTHRYVSPSFPRDKAGNAVWIHTVALVTAPALAKMPALAAARAAADHSQEEEQAMQSAYAEARSSNFMADLRKVRDLPEDADEKAILEAIRASNATKLAASSTAELLLLDLAKSRGEQSARHASEQADKAIARGVFPAYARDWAIATCAADPHAFEGIVERVGAPLAHLFRPAITPEMEANMQMTALSSRLDISRSEAAELVAKQLGLSADDLKD